jgi:hypothetical protein
MSSHDLVMVLELVDGKSTYGIAVEKALGDRPDSSILKEKEGNLGSIRKAEIFSFGFAERSFAWNAI